MNNQISASREAVGVEIKCEQCGYQGPSELCRKCGGRACPACGFRQTIVSQQLVIGADGYKLLCPDQTRYHFERWCTDCYLDNHTKTTIIRLTDNGPVLSRPYPDPVEINGMQEPLSENELEEFDARLWMRDMPFVRG